MTNTTKMLGGWGWIAALVLGLIPWLNILSLAGVICVFIAMFRAGGEVSRPEVSNRLIVALVLGVVSSGVFFLFVGASLFSALLSHGSSATASGIGVGVVLGAVISWIGYVAASWFWYQACISIAEGADAPLLKTGGLVSFIGAIAFVLFGIGAIVGLIGSVMQAIAFFTAPEGARRVMTQEN